ncbi:MAG: UvrD-helicase domain-containing protein [Bacteroidia bacterium]
MDKLLIYKSSAGSGKTYTLVLEYLKLVIADPASFRYVLAVTFTNKATEEMKARIISTLSMLATRDETSLRQEPIWQTLQAHLAAQDLDAGVQQQARKVLNHILNDYSSFAISTIESFFQRVVRAFARELDLPLAYDVEMQQQAVLDRLVDEMLLDLGQDEALTRLLQGFVRRNIEKEKTWLVDREVRKLGMEIFKETFQRLAATEPADSDPADNIERTLALAGSIREIRHRFEAHMTALGRRGLDLMAAYGVSEADFKYGKSGPAAHFRKCAEKGDYTPGDRARQACDDRSAFIAKSNKAPLMPQLEAVLDAGLEGLLRDLVDHYDTFGAEYRTAVEVEKNIYSFGLLRNLQDRLATYRRENRQLIISDTGLLLRQVIGEEQDAPFVYEKVGTRFRHYLLDEFQDTSEMQWLNLLPLIRDALAYGRGSLLVGDVKQSIYRWRNGDMRLLLHRAEQEAAAMGQEATVRHLADNWRTAAEVVRFNNAFFEVAAELLGRDRHDDPLFVQAYDQIAQRPRRDQMPGYVSVMLLPGRTDEAGESWKEAACARTLDIIHDLLADGFAGHEITLLVRKNQQGAELAAFLQQHGIKVVSADSLLIDSAPQVRLLAGLLRYLVQEENPLARASLRHYYARVVLDQSPDHARYTGDAQAYALLDQHAATLRRLPVYACVARLVRLYPVLAQPNAYVQGFLDAALEYTTGMDGGIDGFLEWWDEQRGRRVIATAPDPEAVQVMTIHKAKGLEFPVVILPFAEWPLGPETRDFLWVEPQHPPFDAFPFLPVNPVKGLADTYFDAALAEEETLSALDNLNLLYVAFTRPQYRLYVMGKQPGKQPGLSATAGLIWQVLADPRLEGRSSEGPFHFEAGRTCPRDQLGRDDHADGPGGLPLRDNPDPLAPWEQAARIRLHAGRYLPTQLRQERIAAGELIHEALAHVRTRADIPAAVGRLRALGRLHGGQVPEVQAHLDRVTSLEAAAAWYEPGWDIRNEAEILLPDGSLLRPDRVMLRGTSAIVVDYKTGPPRRTYAAQVQQYRDALRALGYTDVGAFLYYLSAGIVEAV